MSEKNKTIQFKLSDEEFVVLCNMKILYEKNNPKWSSIDLFTKDLMRRRIRDYIERGV